MERDAVISHGMASFLKERMMETADAYTTWICDGCGLFAQRYLKPDHKAYGTERDIYICPACKDKTSVTKIRIPYAFKLLLQELIAMNIAPRMRTKKDQYTS
jgi:DNA-directed RNA polymerase II subunit RPB2